ncbi:MAG TPA: hypothetical protein VGB78_11245 [Thermoplasmata archaeon]
MSGQSGETVDPRDVVRKMEMDYSRGVKDQTEKALEAMVELCARLEDPHADFRAVLRDAADLISRRFSIASVAIAVRDPVDKMYRYETVVGVNDEVVKEFKRLSYTKEQMLDDSKYKSYPISKMTRLYLSEDHPYADGEEFSYRMPGLLDMKRRSVTESLEADYVDVFIHGKGDDIFGWIELSGTRMRKLPDAATIRWTELIACYLGMFLRLSGH